jgi:hypothetical protein
VILAASSQFFRRILMQHEHAHPLLYMKGVKAGQLSDVVDFIYHGEVQLYQEDLDDFLSLAEELGLKGLNETDPKIQKQAEYKPRKSISLLSSIEDNTNYQNVSKPQGPNIWKGMDQILEPENFETSLVPVEELKVFTNDIDLDARVNSMMEQNIDGKWVCSICGKQTNKAHLRSHVEVKHIEGVTHLCGQCGKSFRSRPSLQVHTSNKHRV